MRHDPRLIDEEPTDVVATADLFRAIAEARLVESDAAPSTEAPLAERVPPPVALYGTLAPPPVRVDTDPGSRRTRVWGPLLAVLCLGTLMCSVLAFAIGWVALAQ